MFSCTRKRVRGSYIRRLRFRRKIDIWLYCDCSVIFIIYINFAPSNTHSPHTRSPISYMLWSRVDFGNSIHVSLSSLNLAKLQSTLSAAVRLIGGLRRFARISAFIWDISTGFLFSAHQIQNFDSYAQRFCRVSSFVTPDLLSSLSSLPGRSTLRSIARDLLDVPRMRGAIAQSKNVAHVCPSSWDRQELRLG